MNYGCCTFVCLPDRLAKEDETPAEERIYVDRPLKRSREEDERVAKAVNHTKAALGAAMGKPSLAGGERDDVEADDDGFEAKGGAANKTMGSTARDFGSAMHERMMEKHRQMGGSTAPAAGRGAGASTSAAAADAARTVIDGDGDDDDDEEDGDREGSRLKDFRTEREDRINALKTENKRKGIGRMMAPDAVRGGFYYLMSIFTCGMC